MRDESHQRRSLQHVGGAITTEGEPAAAAALAHALRVAPASDDDEATRAHIHGFHTYPARMHPDTAARLVEAFSDLGSRVLDPFCGSGTVLVEAQRLGRRPFGVDLNPLAVRLTQCKLRRRDVAGLEQLVTLARQCATRADENRIAKTGPQRRFPPEDMQLFEPHVLFELESLRTAVAEVTEEVDRLDLQMVLSAILVKFSRQTGDTSRNRGVRRTAPGSAAAFFVRKTEDLVQRLTDRDRLLPEGAHSGKVVVGNALDARALPTADTIVTSPPYAATYDYVSHHALRLRWLGLDAGEFARGEFGGRDRYHRIGSDRGDAVWRKELAQFMRAASHALKTGRHFVLVMADSAVGGIALRADTIVAEVGRLNGFVPLARASQPRPHFHGPTQAVFRARPRMEHALLLKRL